MIILFTFFTGAFLLSVASTILVDQFLVNRISIAGLLIGLERTQNAGIAFSIDLPAALIGILIPVALILVGVMAYQSRGDKIRAAGFGLILGGALANIFDRLGDGFVTDFIQIGWWPVFNVADSCITIGVLMLLLCEVVKSRKTT